MRRVSSICTSSGCHQHGTVAPGQHRQGVARRAQLERETARIALVGHDQIDHRAAWTAVR